MAKLTQKQEEAVAKKMLASLRDTPNATIQDLARETEEKEADVIRILDEYLVVDGKPGHVGPGGGGGWVA